MLLYILSLILNLLGLNFLIVYCRYNGNVCPDFVMNFVAKQVLKSKTGALTDKLDEVSKKCKEMLDSDEPEPPQPAQNLSEEEQMNQEVCYLLNNHFAVNFGANTIAIKLFLRDQK